MTHAEEREHRAAGKKNKEKMKGNDMFVIVSADGTVRRAFKGTDPATVVELACELQCEGDHDYSLRLAEARRLLEEDTTWAS